MPVIIVAFPEALVSKEYTLFKDARFHQEVAELRRILGAERDPAVILVPGSVVLNPNKRLVPEESVAKLLRALKIPLSVCTLSLSLEINTYDTNRMRQVIDKARAMVGDGIIYVFVNPRIASAFLRGPVAPGELRKLKERWLDAPVLSRGSHTEWDRDAILKRLEGALRK